MSNIWKFIITLSISIALLILLSRNLTLGQRSIPALGHFINPFTGLWTQAESGKAGSQEEFSSPFLSDSVRIEFDQRLVPYVYASNDADAFYAQGFLHAKNRLFQMELTARAIYGRLSEILGEETLQRDVFARRINFPGIIEKKYEAWSHHPDMMALASAYVEGVNDYIGSLEPQFYPLEYKLLNIQPEEWSIRKTLAVSVSLAATLNLNLDDFAQTNTLWNLGPELHHKLFPIFPDTLLPIDVERNTYPDSIPRLDSQQYHHFEYLRDQFPGGVEKGIGSNNWAVRSALTRDSFPILASDPHLRLTLPNIWYELQLRTPEWHTHGVSIPGMPSIIIGFNENTAWGLTNSSLDVMDAYKIKWIDKEHGIYELDGQDHQAILREEVIHIKNKPDHIEKVYDTWWGPVLYGHEGEADHNIAVKWITTEPGESCDFKTMWGLMRATNLEDYTRALEHFYAPGQNIVFASVDDTIAITVQGHFPVKKPDQGRFILDGSFTENDWQGIIPQEHLPRMVNPERQYVISANEWPTFPEYPYFYSGRFDYYRGRTISRYLQTRPALTVPQMMEIQTSNFNLKAAELLPRMLEFIDEDSRFKDSLIHWDYHYEADSPLPTFAEMWINECMRLSFDEITVPVALPRKNPEEWRFRELLDDPDDPVFDIQSTPEIRENAGDVIREAWDSALESFHLIPSDQRAWGRSHSLSIPHLLGISEFSHLDLKTGGNGDTVNATTRTNGPSWRMIVQMVPDSVHAHVIYPGGQSGNPGSPYYDNFISDWLDGKYYPVRLEQNPDQISHSMNYSIYLAPQ